MRTLVGSDPAFSPSEFVAVLNQSLEMLYPSVTITGELANFRISKNKWVYFDLKDTDASVKFFGTIYMLPGPLEDGLTVEVRGRPRLHPQFGFSVQIDSIRAVGEGSVKKAQDLLQKKLETEGLFSPERKRLLPYPPSRIGLVASAESAAITDFYKIITARWPMLRVELADTLVQGATAPASIVAAINSFAQSSEPPEVLVIIRGGGSADDLAAFSEESVVRAVAASRIPTMVAIGHENDISLAELAADQRASTPSNAAELLVPNQHEEQDRLASQSLWLNGRMQEVTDNGKRQIQNIKVDVQRLLLDAQRQADRGLSVSKSLLSALNPVRPLMRGYVLVRDTNGKMVKSTSKIKRKDDLDLQFYDGSTRVSVTSIRKN